jgi:hypothetical protein
MSDDELINLLSRWLAGHASDDELRRGATGLPDVREAFEVGASRPQLMVAVRESLETLALG